MGKVTEQWQVPPPIESRHPGCRIMGYLDVNHVAGKLEIKVHGAPPEMAAVALDKENHAHYNISQRVDHLSFGREYPGQSFPLDGIARMYNEQGNLINDPSASESTSTIAGDSSLMPSAEASANVDGVGSAAAVYDGKHSPRLQHHYFLQVVPTRYTELSGEIISTNQFSATEHTRRQAIGELPSLVINCS